MATLEDLDRRVAALEKAAETEKNIVRAVSELVSEAGDGLRNEMSGLRADMRATEQRLNDRMDDTARRMVDVLNERFDAVMAALDRPKDPPA